MRRRQRTSKRHDFTVCEAHAVEGDAQVVCRVVAVDKHARRRRLLRRRRVDAAVAEGHFGPAEAPN
eukprot:6180593-Pleurochrysis_carterae.AAC.2